MTNTLALFLGFAIIAAIGLDIFLFDAANLLFLARKMFVLLDWLAFWR